MESKVSYTLVGLFVIILSAALAAAVVWLTIGTQDKVYYPYKVYMTESVAGLNPKASVKYRGVDVGQVESIEIDPVNPEQVELLLNIETHTPVRTDTKAVLTVQGITGLAYLELTGGSKEAPPLAPTEEDPVPVIESGPSLVARLDEAFTKMVNTFNDLAGPLSEAVSKENVATLSRTLSNLQTITSQVEDVTAAFANRSESMGKALDSAVAALEDITRISTRLAPLLAQVSSGVEAVGEMTKTFTQTSRELGEAVQESRKEIQRMARSTAPELNALLTELGQLADTLQRFVQELERNPRMLLLGRPSGQPGPGEE